MKKMVFIPCLFIISFLFQSLNYTQSRNPVLEYCTGTWCQWCPCGHSIIKNEIKPAHPNVIVISYHGPANGSDPFSFFPGNTIISALGFTGYPTGIVDRTSPPQGRTTWLNNVSNRKNVPPTVSITSIRQYNPATRELNLNINSTALVGLTGTFNLNVILLEDSLIYPQTGNSSCPGSSSYIHDNVVRAMINGATGEVLVTSKWDYGQTISKQIRYTIPNNIVEKNASIVAFIYKSGSALNISEIQQAEKWKLLDTTATSVILDLEQITDFNLFQNFPNPFNPSTIISWQSPVNGRHTIKLYDVFGREIETIVDGYYSAGKNSKLYVVNSSLPSGIYFYQLRIGNYSETKKMILIR
jgi:hypothetical protein